MMDPKTTAVVLIEYQNDFTSEGGTLHQAVKPVMDSTNMLPNTIETVEKARSLGATIIFAPITFTADYHELRPEPYGILKGVVDSKDVIFYLTMIFLGLFLTARSMESLRWRS